MTLPCVCELIAGGKSLRQRLRQLFELTNKGARRIELRASSQNGAPGPLRSQRRRDGRDGRPARRTGQLHRFRKIKTSQQIEHTRTSHFLCRRVAPTEKIGGPST